MKKFGVVLVLAVIAFSTLSKGYDAAAEQVENAAEARHEMLAKI